MDLNKVSLIGNVVNTPIFYGGKTPDVNITVATNYIWQDKGKRKENVQVFDVVAFGHLAEIINEYVKPQSKLYIEGRLRNTKVIDENKKVTYMTDIVAEDIILLGKRKDNSNA